MRDLFTSKESGVQPCFRREKRGQNRGGRFRKRRVPHAENAEERCFGDGRLGDVSGNRLVLDALGNLFLGLRLAAPWAFLNRSFAARE